jgi:hypothetical protein
MYAQQRLVPHVIVNVCTICRVDEDFSGDKTRRRYAESRAGADVMRIPTTLLVITTAPRDRCGLPPGPHVRDPPAGLHRLTPREGKKFYVNRCTPLQLQ